MYLVNIHVFAYAVVSRVLAHPSELIQNNRLSPEDYCVEGPRAPGVSHLEVVPAGKVDIRGKGRWTSSYYL